MKNLKTTLNLLTLLLCVSVTVFFTSCKNDVSNTELPAKLEVNQTLDNKTIILPSGFDNLDAEIDYLQNISDEEAEKLVANYTVTMFLLQENKLEDVKRNLADFKHISDVNLDTHLSADQLDQLRSFTPENVVESRGLNCWTQTGYCYTRKRCCFTDGWDTYCWTAWTINVC